MMCCNIPGALDLNQKLPCFNIFKVDDNASYWSVAGNVGATLVIASVAILAITTIGAAIVIGITTVMPALSLAKAIMVTICIISMLLILAVIGYLGYIVCQLS